jgi:hypothetical protein
MDIDNYQVTVMLLLVEKFEKIEIKLNEFEKTMSDRKNNKLSLIYNKLKYISCNY